MYVCMCVYMYLHISTDLYDMYLMDGICYVYIYNIFMLCNYLQYSAPIVS